MTRWRGIHIDVRFGSLADIPRYPGDVRFYPRKRRARSQFLTPVDLPFYSATIIQVSVPEAAMATRRKAKGKAGGKRKKAPVTKLATRRKAARKAKTTSKKTAKKVSPRSASTKKTKANREDHFQAGAAIRFAGTAYRRRDPLLQPSVSRDHAARARYYTAGRRPNPHSRTHHRLHPEGRLAGG
jgi:hypothetical protein